MTVSQITAGKKGEYFYAHYMYDSNYRLSEFHAVLLRTQLSQDLLLTEEESQLDYIAEAVQSM